MLKKFANKLGIEVHAGHGLDYKTTKILTKIKEIKNLILVILLLASQSFDGLKKVIKKFKKIIK